MLIALVGLPGVGKSTIGRRLAARCAVDFVDCDHAVEARIGESIAAYFEREGEGAFRDIETDVLAHLLETRHRAVLATGGGIVERPVNRQLLSERCFCVYLRAQPDQLLPRLRRSGRRPMFNGADAAVRLDELIGRRHPLYDSVAHLSVDTVGHGGERVVELVLDAVRRSRPGEVPE